MRRTRVRKPSLNSAGSPAARTAGGSLRATPASTSAGDLSREARGVPAPPTARQPGHFGRGANTGTPQG